MGWDCLSLFAITPNVLFLFCFCFVFFVFSIPQEKAEEEPGVVAWEVQKSAFGVEYSEWASQRYVHTFPA